MRSASILILFLFSVSNFYSQTYSSSNITLLGYINPDTSTVPSPVGNRYSGCWGWYQANKKKEYAISGSRNGTFFIDITNPSSPTVCAFIGAKKGCTWREMKTYKNFCYIISDDAKPNLFQIVDMQYLPDSVKVIHSGTDYFEKGHTIWIDNDLMYIGMTTFNVGSSPMSIWSLKNPLVPNLLKRLENDIPNNIIGQVHDMYARNDTVYASSGWQGLFMLRYDQTSNTLYSLGSYNGYAEAGYNHSGSLTQNGKYVVFCDEVPASLPIHCIDVQNPSNMQPLQDFRPNPSTTPHNPYTVGNNYVVVSCYKDGLYIYDISNPSKILLAGYFDTYPQEGANTGDYGGGAYGGNWSAYPWLPSGLIIANDMQNGVFILNPKKAYTNLENNFVTLPQSIQNENFNLQLFPNPVSNYLVASVNISGHVTIEITNIIGEIVFTKNTVIENTETIDVSGFENGTYVFRIKNQNGEKHSKFVVMH